VVFEDDLLESMFQNFTTEYFSKFISSSYFPKQKCLVPKNKHVAIIIPFRDPTSTQDRTKHLKWLLLYTIPALIRQNIHFRFYVINQGKANQVKINKYQKKNFLSSEKAAISGLLIVENSSILVFKKLQMTASTASFSTTSILFSKTTVICIYARVILATMLLISTNGITNLFTTTFLVELVKFESWSDLFFVNTVVSFTKETFLKLNGYSNQYWGWGGEDDDLHVRLREVGYTIIRPYDETSKYKMISHGSDKGNEQNPRRHTLLGTASKRLGSDGLSVSQQAVLPSLE